jgi:hypothetical protein
MIIDAHVISQVGQETAAIKVSPSAKVKAVIQR